MFANLDNNNDLQSAAQHPVWNTGMKCMCVIYFSGLCYFSKLRKEQFIREKNDKLEYEP